MAAVLPSPPPVILNPNEQAVWNAFMDFLTAITTRMGEVDNDQYIGLLETAAFLTWQAGNAAAGGELPIPNVDGGQNNYASINNAVFTGTTTMPDGGTWGANGIENVGNVYLANNGWLVLDGTTGSFIDVRTSNSPPNDSIWSNQGIYGVPALAIGSAAPPASGILVGQGNVNITGGGTYEINGVPIFQSPALTGTPTAPTPAANNNSTAIATTAFVDAAITAGLGGLSGAYLPLTGGTVTGYVTINGSPSYQTPALTINPASGATTDWPAVRINGSVSLGSGQILRSDNVTITGGGALFTSQVSWQPGSGSYDWGDQCNSYSRIFTGPPGNTMMRFVNAAGPPRAEFVWPILMDGGATEPASPLAGLFWYNTGSNVMEYYNGTSWVPMTGGTGGGGSVTSITAGAGLTGGTISTSGTIALATPVSVANGGTGQSTLTGHGLLIGEGTGNVASVAPVATGRVLFSNGLSVDPSWTATPTLGVAGSTLGTLTFASSVGAGTVTLSPPSGLGTSYTITWPSAVPGNYQVPFFTSPGVMGLTGTPSDSGQVLQWNGSTPRWTSTPALGNSGSSPGTLSLTGGLASNGTVTLSSQTAAYTNYTFQFPAGAPANGSLLVFSGGTGVTAGLADVAAGSVLTSAGATAVPAWSNSPSLTGLTLSTPLPVASGGTGSSTVIYAPLTNPANGQNNYAPLANATFTGTTTFPDGSSIVTAGANNGLAGNTYGFQNSTGIGIGVARSATTPPTGGNALILGQVNTPCVFLQQSGHTASASIQYSGGIGGWVDIGYQAYYNGSSWVSASSIGAAMIGFNGSGPDLDIFVQGGLTAGNTFTWNSPILTINTGAVLANQPFICSLTNGNTQYYLGGSGSNTWGSISSVQANNLNLAAGTYAQGANWYAAATTSAIFSCNAGGTFSWFANSGLTVGAQYGPVQFATLDSSSGMVCSPGFRATGFFLQGGTIPAGTYTSFGAGGQTNSLTMVVNNTGIWYMRDGNPDWLAWNPTGPSGGNGAYQNISDIRAKQNIRLEERGLEVIRRLQPIMFQRTYPDGKMRDLEIGFSAQDVQPILPEAVKVIGSVLPDGSGGLDSDEPTLAIAESAIFTVLVNAVKQLDARLAAMERMYERRGN